MKLSALPSQNSSSLPPKQSTKSTIDAVVQVFTDIGEKEKILSMEEYGQILYRKILTTNEECFRKCREMNAPTR
ncbi:hypothetical protein FACS1894176_11040 [Bacteroidia bacterium]|nr:hypothetical protein FACS1894176_11040 [Bacteroidia bacterium]